MRLARFTRWSSKTKKSSKWQKSFLVAGLAAGALGVSVLLQTAYADEEEDSVPKPKLVILGSGWAATGLLKQLGDSYDVSVVSPRNYFLFTPLLPCVTVGSLEARTITQPIRDFLFGKSTSKFYEAACYDLDIDNNTVRCKDASAVTGVAADFALPYDYLVMAVGSINNTFGCPGVEENAHFLKSVEDAIGIRKQIIDCFETANNPGLTEKERKDMLSFVVVGGGPTGVEYAAELSDFVHEDLKKFFPNLIPHVKVHLIQSGSHILNTFDEKISQYTEGKFERDNIHVMTNHRVHAVNEDNVTAFSKKTKKEHTIPFGLCVWSTGVKPNPLVQKIRDSMPLVQRNKHGLLVDDTLLVKGTKNVFAIGDCAVLDTPKLHDHLIELFQKADTDNNNALDRPEFDKFLKDVLYKYPQLAVYSNKVEDLFERADTNKDGSLSMAEFEAILRDADKYLKVLPTTAQVASQEGAYLGKALNDRASGSQVKPFVYHHMGSLAYVGKSAVAELPGDIKANGFWVWWLWRGIYWSKQFSFKAMYLLSVDWTRALFLGRDTSRF